MRRFNWLSQNITVPKLHGPTPIAVGLLFLMAAMLWPGMPAVTGMALVTLGATDATLARYRRSVTRLPILVLHAAIYGGLYAIFVGATLDALNTMSAARQLVYAVTAVDLAISVVPMGIAIERAWQIVRDSRLAQ